ncbi:hypothetical protein FBALC1_11217 [Flavobacteriales bacterium ALC-1]|nr:hypothetical protein FBALC1_11217 [Flavobacteriales bacterium ALC-1]
MKVINIHKRTIQEPKEKVSQLFETLATDNDLVWPYENWPAIYFKKGLKIGNNGGHGRIRYTIIDYKVGEYIKFQFLKPEGLNGTHELNVEAINEETTEVSHIIRAKTSFKATFFWIFVIRWLHDALIEDAFDKVENYFSTDKKTNTYNFWVKYLREAYKKKSFKTKQA